MIRTIWFVLNLLVLTTFFGTLAVVAGLFGIRNRQGGVYDFCTRRWSKMMLAASGAKLRLAGMENIPANQPVVFVSNHQSWFDIFILGGYLPGQVRFVAKKELSKIPILGRAMKSAEHIFIDRQNRQAAFAAYEEASATIHDGMSAVVFAEGTRSRTGELQPFKKGPFVLAIASRVPILPVYCAGTFTLLPKGTLRIRPHPVAALIGEPISTDGLVYEDRERLMAEARVAIEALRDESEELLGSRGDGSTK
jgi:1-acyl-sn-glycerol-3-phosphate acyltransferase